MRPSVTTRRSLVFGVLLAAASAAAGGIDDSNAAMAAHEGQGRCTPMTDVVELAKDLSTLKVGETVYQPFVPEPAESP